MMVRALAAGTVVALAAALSVAERSERPEPEWVDQICADVAVC